MNLTSQTQSLQIVLGEAKTTSDCDITASWAEMTIGTMLLQNSALKSNGTSAVTVVSAPAHAQTWEQVKEVRLHNNDTVIHKVSVLLNVSGTTFIVLQSSVAAGGDFVYTPEVAAAPAAQASVTDGTTTVPNVVLVNFTAGATVSSGGTGTANIAINDAGTGTATAVAGAATLNTASGIVTSEALVAATTYTLTLTNSKVKTTSVVIVNQTNSAALPVTLTSVTPGSGSVVIVIGMAALTGTAKIAFVVFN